MGLDWCLENPCEAIDAPMVDTEERAREIWEDYAKDQYKHDSFEEFWDWANPENRDEPMADCEKCRVWEEYLDGRGGGSFLSNLCEWRGKRLKYVGRHRIKWLVDGSYEDRDPEEMRAFADKIERLLLEDEDNREFHEFDEADLQTLREAVAWLRYWADEGVSMYAWY